MPIDTSIYQQPPSQGFNTPFQTLAQIGAIQRQRQEIASEKALEQERQQKLADQQRSVQSDQVLSQLFQQHTKINPDTGVTETDHQAVYNGLMGVDPKKAEAYLTVADAAQQRFNAFQLQHQQLAKGALDLQNGLAQIVKDAPPDKRADVWAINRVALGTVNPGVLDHIPQQYPGDDELDKMMNKGQSLSEQIANKFKASETAKNLAEAKKAEGEAGKTPPVTEAALDAAQQALLAKQALGQPLTAEEAASVKAYQERKRTVSDPAAVAATERQTATIAASTATQKRAQDFAALQAARADLEKNVNTPYLTAQTSANTLRDVVEAAKGGNVTAGALQSLEATMAAIRAQGLNRINTAEIGVTQDAGSLWQRLQGWMGKAAAGQPVAASVQKDMLDFATILEKAAYKKYQKGHKATNTLYGTSIPEMLTGPDAAAPTGSSVPAGIRSRLGEGP